MAQRNIDFGSFPDDPNADAIRTAFDKVQQNFTELFSGLQEQAVISVNRTAGVGTSVNSPTGNVIISANIAQVRIQSTTLDLVAGAGTPGPLAVINQGTVPISINLPQSVTGISNITLGNTLTANTVNVNLQINGNTASFTGNITSISNVIAGNVYANSGTIAASSLGGTLTTAAQPNITSVGTLSALSVTGNLSSGNANLGNLAVANFFSGNGSLLTGVIAVPGTTIVNGNSNVNIATANGNVTITAVGNTTMTVTGTGANITGTLGVTGNITAGNLVGILANGGTSNITIASATGNVTTAVAGTARITATSTGANVTGTLGVSSTLGVTGNANVGNLGTAQVLASANVTSPQFISNIATGTAPLVVTSTTRVSNLNVAYANVADFISVAAGTGNNFLIFANAATGNVTELTSTGLTANLSNNSITATTFVGALSGAATTAGTVTTAAQPNITSVGTLTSLGVNGTVTAVAFTANTGIFTGNGSALTALNASNISSGTLAQARLANSNVILGNTTLALGTTTTTVTGLASVTSTTFVGDLTGAATSATTAGTVTTNAQPNITSVGTLTSLGVSGTVTAAAFTANTGIFTGNGSALTALNASNISSGTLAQARLANSNVILGNTTLALGTTTTTIAGLSSVTSTTFVGALTGAATSATTAGTVTTNAQPNITSTGTLTSLAVTGNATAGNVYANSGTIGASLLAGTLTTATQPNITSVGTLTSLGVTGNITAANFVGALANGNSDINIPANGNINFDVAGNANMLVVTGTGANIAGTLNATGNANVANLGTGRVIATGNISGTQLLSNIATGTAPLVVTSTTRVSNLNVANAGFADAATSATNAAALLQNTSTATTVYPTFSTSSANGNSQAVINTGISANLGNASITATTFVGALSGNATTAGTVITAAQPNITSVGTLTSLSVSGAVTASTLTSNVATGTAPLTVTSTTRVSNLNVAYANVADNINVATGTGNNFIVFANAETGNVTELTSAGLTANLSNNSITATTFVGALSGAATSATSATTAGTVTTAAQPNITSVGTLSSLAVTGNLSSGNANLGNAAAANFFVGDGSLLTNIAVGAGSFIQNGNSEVRVDANSNVRVSVAGTANVLTVTSTGADIAGNLSAGNISATTLSGNVISPVQSSITSLGTLTGLTVNGVSNLGSNSNVVITGGVANAFLRTNGSGGLIWDTATLIPAQGANTQVIFNDGGSTYAGSNSLTFNSSTNVLTVAGNITAGNISGSNNIFSNFFTGTLRTAAQPNITSVGTLTTLNVNNTITAVAFTANTGVFTGNGAGLTNLSGANVTGTVANATYALNAGNATNATSATSATTAGTVTTNAQPNITSVGTLVGLAVTGTVNAGNVTATLLTGTLTTAAQPNITSVSTSFTGLTLAANGNITLSGASSQITGANLVSAGFFSGNGSSITGINANSIASGTLAQARLANSNVILGNTTLALGSTTTTVAGLTSVTSTTFVGSLTGAATTAGTVTTAAQPNITSVGTLTSLGANGTITGTQLISNIAVGTAPLTVTSTTRVANLNVATAGTADTAGSATNASAVTTTLRTTGTYFLPFISATANANYGLNSNAVYSANIADGSLTATTFVGDLSGTADNATNAAIATNAFAVLTNTSTATTVYLTGTSTAVNSHSSLSKVTGIFANMSNNSITATTFVGSLSGTATSATTAGTVTTNAQPNITSVSTSFTGLTLAANGNITLSGANSQITGANLISAGFFSGNGSSITGINANSIASGTLAQARLANSSLTVNGTAISLGGSGTITANTTQTLSNGTYITGDSFNGGTARTWAVDATTTNTANKVVARDTNGSFSANIITATLSGSATSAGTATNASAVLNNVRSTGTYYPAFISATANGNYALNSNTAFSANITTGRFFATIFDGNLNVSNTNFVTSIIRTGVVPQYFGNTEALSGAVSFNRYRGNIDTIEEVQNGDRLGLIEFLAFDGFVANTAASITSIVDATYTSGSGSAPGAIVFNTANAAQGGVPTEKMRVTSTGNVGIANTNPAHTLSITGTLNASGNANVLNIGASGGVFTGNTSAANVVATGYHIRSVETGIIALGLTQGTATALTKEINVVSTVVPLVNSGVKLPVAVPGMVITIINTSANAVLVWPNTGGDINGAAANAAYSHSAGATLQYIAPTTTDWYTVGATFA
jgi:hypothetical protein